MEINKLSKISYIIGKSLFYLLFTLFLGVYVLSILMKENTNFEYSISNVEIEDKLWWSNDFAKMLGSIIGLLLGSVIIYFGLRLLFSPIYNLKNSIQLRLENQFTHKQFKIRWILSLICSLIIGVPFIIGTFGISFLLMLPQYVLLYKSRKL